MTRYRYDVARQPVGVAGPDPDGSGPMKNRALRYNYDGAGRMARVDQGSVVSQSDSDWPNFTTLASQSAACDTVGHLTLAYVGPLGASTAVTQYAYDAAMRLTCTVVRMNSGAFGSLPSSACTSGALGPYGPDRITYDTYDAANHLTKVTSGYGTSVQRDDVTTTYGYDGETLSQADAKGNLTSYLYDGFNRLIQVNFPLPGGGGHSSGSDFEGYAYDANSNLVSDRRRDGQTINYGYDAGNRLTSGANGATYGYDTLGRMTSASVSGQTTTYAWDALSRQVSEAGPLGTLSRQFDLDGRRTRLTYPDGWYINYAYDPASEVISISESAVNLTNYGYDDLGRRTLVQRPSVATTHYTFGSDLHLAVLEHDFVDGSKNETFGFWYNAAGQVRSSTSSNAMYDWTAPANIGRNYAADGQNRYTTAGSTSYGYDARSNLSSDGVNTYAYDVTNRLTNLSNGATLGYDAASRLFQTTGSSTTRFLYDGDQIVAEYGTSGNVLRRYVPGPTHDEPIVWYEGSGSSDRRWLMADRQGSVIAVANGSGTTIGVNTYDDAGIPGSSNIGRFQFDAMAWVPEAGLYHARARAYSTTLGRFMQSDPIAYGDGMNFFNYAHGDPVNRLDRSGLDDAVPEVVVTARPEIEIPDAGAPDPGNGAPGFGGGFFAVGGVTVYKRRGQCKAADGCFPAGAPLPPLVQFGGTPMSGGQWDRQKLCAAAKIFNKWSDNDASTGLKAVIVAAAAAPIPVVGEVVTPVAAATAAVADLSAGVEGLVGAGLGAAASGEFGSVGARAAVLVFGLFLPGSQGMGGSVTRATTNLVGMGGEHVAGHVADSLAPGPC